MDSLIKAGLYYKPTQDMKQGKRESLQRAANLQYVRKHLARRDSNSNRTS